MTTTQTKDTVAKTIEIYATTDYGKFGKINGNRDVNVAHVRQIEHSILENGDLGIEEPIEVTKELDVFDGQHRLAARKNLKLPIYYKLRKEATVPKIRVTNAYRKNWNWYDFAVSYRDDIHNVNYTQFLELYETYQLNFGILVTYTTGRTQHDRTMVKKFFEGNFIIKDIERSKQLLDMYEDYLEITKIRGRDFASASYKFISSSTYKHEYMLTKLKAHKSVLNSCYLESDYLFALQDIRRA